MDGDSAITGSDGEENDDEIIEPERDVSELAALEDRLVTLIGGIGEQIASIEQRINTLESDASNDTGNDEQSDRGTDTAEQPTSIPDVPEPDTETETGTTSEASPIKRPRRIHPYYKRLW